MSHPHPTSSLKWLYLDFDSFFASAEQHMQPQLRGKPVAVIPLKSPATCVIAASKEAKKWGVKTGVPVREARRLCPDVTFVVARHDVYCKLHHRILEVVGNKVPIHAVRSIDEVACRLMDNESADAEGLAQRIKAGLRMAFSPVLTCSIGFAGSELLAKIAAEMDKPDGVVLLSDESLPGRLSSLSLRDLPGIARGIEARLNRAGIHDVAALWALAPKQARAIWGGVEGERFLASLHGQEVERPATQRGMFSHSRILPYTARSLNDAYPIARLLLVKAARRMRREGFLAKTLILTLKPKDADSWSRAVRFAAAQNDHVFLQALGALFREAHRSHSCSHPKAVHVTLIDVIKPEDVQLTLFDTSQEKARQQKWDRISQMTDVLSQRFGHHSLTLGIQHQPKGGFAGGKIAFHRVPDKHDF
jgi:DNA polymerase IV